jgi:hypothetical protein
MAVKTGKRLADKAIGGAGRRGRAAAGRAVGQAKPSPMPEADDAQRQRLAALLKEIRAGNKEIERQLSRIDARLKVR